jgi:sialidase-1
MGKISEDRGRTWTKPFEIVSNDARVNVGRLSLVRIAKEWPSYGGWVKGKSSVALIYTKLAGPYHDGIYIRISRDECRTWSKEERINPSPSSYIYTAHLNDSAIEISGNRLIVPVSLMFRDLVGSTVYFSDDEGLTWQKSTGEVIISRRSGNSDRGVCFSHFAEPTVAELKDKRLIMFGRTLTGRIYQSFSGDRGVTWSDPEPTELASSWAPALLKTVPSTGDLMVIWNQASDEEMRSGLFRMRLSCAISTDDGKTWRYFKNLESLDDTTRIEPPEAVEPADGISEAGITGFRIIWPAGTSLRQPDKKRYPLAPGYVHVDYPSLTFTRDNRAVITYGASDYGADVKTTGWKLRIIPVEWFYENE